MNSSGIHIDTYAAYARFDPTRTTSLRNQFARKMNNKFNELIYYIHKAVVDRDCFGLIRPDITALQMYPPGYRAFDFRLSKDKIEAFMQWLQDQVNRGILEVQNFGQYGLSIEEVWAGLYIVESYKRGVLRARQELNKAGYNVPSVEQAGGISAIMNTPLHIDRVGLLYLRMYNDLKGITDNMSSQISRVLAQGMADGDGPVLLARKMRAVVDGVDADKLGITDTLGRFIPAKRRAEILARTEIIRAHHVATIQEYRNWEAIGVVVQAEWMTAGDSRVCDRCQSLQGHIFTLDQIEGMIPLHPQCRCIALPFKEGMRKTPSPYLKPENE